MSILFVYHVSSPDLPNKVLTHFEDIAATLAEHGVVFDRLEARTSIRPGADVQEVTGAYRTEIDALMTERGHVSVDVISLDRNHPEKTETRARLLAEHGHSADEVRFFVAGRGLCSLHIGDLVFAVECERNDVMSIPAGTRQWFDIGEDPHLAAIRLFKTVDGGLATTTGDDLAGSFPGLDD
jgi:1,2-dihydroxy-3-keto-5-methylthiopentene dioxygenase